MTKSNASPSDKFNTSAKEETVPDFIYVDHYTGENTSVAFKDVTIKTPLEKTTLIKNINLTINNGERIGLTGPNGAGKSTIFRAMAELNSAGSGHIDITLPENKKIFIASQEIRKTPTTLPGLLSYPNRAEKYTHEQYEQCLDEAGLSEIKIHLPWNAAKPNVLFAAFTKNLDPELDKYIGKMTTDCAQDMADAVAKIIYKKLEVSELIRDHFTDEYRDILTHKIKDHVTGVLSCDENKKGKSLLFAGHTARKVARKAMTNANNAIENWLLQGHKMRLSGGQQQKLIFARMFLQVEEVGLFLLDEVTAALKEDTAHELYNKLFEKAEGVTAISIIHNDGLLRHHTHHLELDESKHLTLTKLNQDDSEPAPQPTDI